MEVQILEFRTEQADYHSSGIDLSTTTLYRALNATENPILLAFLDILRRGFSFFMIQL
jgi:DNA-binding phage protein